MTSEWMLRYTESIFETCREVVSCIAINVNLLKSSSMKTFVDDLTAGCTNVCLGLLQDINVFAVFGCCDQFHLNHNNISIHDSAFKDMIWYLNDIPSDLMLRRILRHTVTTAR